MHINARGETPSKAFCFIIEYTPYIESKPGIGGPLGPRITWPETKVPLITNLKMKSFV